MSFCYEKCVEKYLQKYLENINDEKLIANNLISILGLI